MTVREVTPLREALQVLEATAAQILLIADADDHLLGTITDGDIRRAILSEYTMMTPVSAVLNPSPATGMVGLPRSDALAIMRRLSIHALPLLNDAGQIRGLVFDGDRAEATPRDTAVVLMAGGRGQRLRPLTDSLPKPLVRVGGVPLAEATIRRLQAQGFRNIWLAVHYRAADVEEHFGDGSLFGVNVSYLREESPMGTVGAVSLLPGEAREPVLVVNGDLISAIDFGALVDAHEARGTAATIGAVAHLTELPFGVIRESDGMLTSIEEKPVREDLVASGVTVLSARAVALLSQDEPCDMPDLIRALLAAGESVAVSRLEAYWLDVGTQAALTTGHREHASVTLLQAPTASED